MSNVTNIKAASSPEKAVDVIGNFLVGCINGMFEHYQKTQEEERAHRNQMLRDRILSGERISLFDMQNMLEVSSYCSVAEIAARIEMPVRIVKAARKFWWHF